MSKKNVEVVRWAYENSHARRTVDVPGIEERVTPGYTFHPRDGWPGPMAYRLDEMTALWADLDSTFSDHSLVPQSYEAIGSTDVLVTLHQTARLRGSDHRINDTIYMLWRLVEGRADETWTFTDRAMALEAAGSRE
jgi:hypothetical protein